MGIPSWALGLGAVLEAPKVANNYLGLFKNLNDFRDESNASDALSQLQQFKTSSDLSSFQPKGYLRPQTRQELDKLRQERTVLLQGQEAAPYHAEATRLNRMAANDPYIGSPEGLADFAQRPGFWLDQTDTGTISGAKDKAPATADGANPYTAQVVQTFGDHNQNVLDAFKAGNQDPMALARLTQNKDLASSFKDVQQANNYLVDNAVKKEDATVKEAQRLTAQKNLSDFASSVGMLTTPSERTGKMMPFGEAAALVNQAAADYPVTPEASNLAMDNLLNQYKETRFPTAGKTGRTTWTGTQNLMGDINKDVTSVAPVTNVYNVERGQRKDEQALRKEFLSLPEVKEYPTVENQIQRGLMALKEPGSNKIAVDQTVITVLNKMLDPSSVVRESEYARIPQDMAALNRIKGKFEKLKTGGAGLTDIDRQALVRMTQNFSAIASKQYNSRVSEYKALAKDYGYSPERVVPRKNALDEAGNPQGDKEPKGNIAPVGLKARLKDGTIVISDGKGGWAPQQDRVNLQAAAAAELKRRGLSNTPSQVIRYDSKGNRLQ